MMARMMDGPAKGKLYALEKDYETIQVAVIEPAKTQEAYVGPAPQTYREVIYRRAGFAHTGEALFFSEWGTTVTPALA